MELAEGLKFAKSLHLDISTIIDASRFDTIVYGPQSSKPKPFMELW